MFIGTEEILGTLDINDDVEPQIKTKPTKGKKSKVIEVEPFVNSMITKSSLQSTSIETRPTQNKKTKFRAIWEEALEESSSSSSPIIYENPKNVIVPVYPVPLTQPAHWLNKYATKKLPLEEPRFREVNSIGKMIFHENSLRKRFDGTKACSKIAGNFFKQVLKQSQFLFSPIWF